MDETSFIVGVDLDGVVGDFYGAMRKIAAEWLDYHDIPYWDLCLMGDKGAVGAHVYIDDAPENVIRLRNQGCRTIVFTNSTNRGISGPRADSWLEMEQLVMEAQTEWKTGTLDLFGAPAAGLSGSRL
jgi:beta-phosphoglucomutase-like phosphatase (HAD superfamily)